MKKQLTNKTVYEPNQGVKITVVNKPEEDDLGGIVYTAEVTVKVKRKGLGSELRFTTDDEIADFMAQVEYDDPQQSLPM